MTKPEAVPSKIPIAELLAATDELGTKSKLRVLIVSLANKIDMGFSSMLMFLNTTTTKLAAVEARMVALEEGRREDQRELRELQERLSTAETRARSERPEPSIQIELARREGREAHAKELAAKAEDERRHALEWAKLGTAQRIAIVTAAGGVTAAIIAAIVKLLAG